MISGVNRVTTFITDLILRPFTAISPWPVLVAASIFVALLALLAFKLSSRQADLRRAKGRLFAHILELHLFRDDLPAIFGVFVRVLGSVLGYLKEAVKPVLLLLIPLGLFLAHLAGWLESRPFREGDTTLLTLRLDPAVDAASVSVSVSGSPEVAVETGAFRSPRDNEISWRLRACRTGSGWVDVTVAGEECRKRVEVTRLVRRVSIRRVRDGLWQSLAYPAEARLPKRGVVRWLHVDYPVRDIRLAGMHVHWLLAVFVLSMIFALALKYPLRVEL